MERNKGQPLTNSLLRTEVIIPTAPNNYVSMKENPSPVNFSDDAPASTTPSSQPMTDPKAEDTANPCLPP